ncbi:DinB family protein [Adhaeribacter radiodurans]|uniref:Damage-inducible protein DinB n=1 Tax=Adhaeribacter radiodurans TaxID=2745197 RepID=A0A7L7LE92_9BACT|nr:DinB family protein [Adhaeribacter radiodurans]QMU31067.1 damage-inducible protein DinB [Adhaeribacter radiodurans]
MAGNTLQKLAAYTSWANQRLLEILEKFGSQIPSTSLHLFSHLLNAEIIWLARIQHLESPVQVFDEHTLAECRRLQESTFERFIGLADSLPEELETLITYKNTKGENFTTSLEDILMQVFNHGTYHRAQIARDLRQNGLEPLNTDYITFVLETGGYQEEK